MQSIGIDLIEHITKQVFKELQKDGIAFSYEASKFVSVGVSARHVHLSKEHLEALFGKGFKLSKFKDILQPRQFASNEKVTVVGPKGKIENVRILGPERQKSQVEVAASDARKLGVTPEVRESGKLHGTSGVTLLGPNGSVTLNEGCIISERHIHMTPNDAYVYEVHDGQKVMVKVDGQRGGIMDNVYIRVREDFALDLHIDTDDASAFMIKDKDMVEIIK